MSSKTKYRDESLRLQLWDYGWNGSYFITICTKHRIHHLGEIENETLALSEIGKIATANWLMIPQKFPYIKLGAFVIMPNHVHGILTIDKNAVKSMDSLKDLSNTSSKGLSNESSKELSNELSKGFSNESSKEFSNELSKESSSGDAINRVPTGLTNDHPSTGLTNDHPSTGLTNDHPSTALSKDNPAESHMLKIENFDPHQTSPSKMVGGVTGNKNPMLHNNISRVIRWYKGRTTYESRKISTDFAWQSRFYDHIIRNNFSHRNITNYINSNVKNWGKDKLI